VALQGIRCPKVSNSCFDGSAWGGAGDALLAVIAGWFIRSLGYCLHQLLLGEFRNSQAVSCFSIGCLEYEYVIDGNHFAAISVPRLKKGLVKNKVSSLD